MSSPTSPAGSGGSGSRPTPGQPGAAGRPPTGKPLSAAHSSARASGGPGEPVAHTTSWTAYIKPALWALLLLYVVLFVFLNRGIVEINFLFFTAQVPLIFVLLGVGVIGAVLSTATGIWIRHRDAKKAKAAATSSTSRSSS